MVWPPAALPVTHVDNNETVFAATDNAQAQAINDTAAHVVALEAAFVALAATVTATLATVVGRWRRAANQAVTTATLTTISWDVEDEDSDGFLTPTSTTATIPGGKGGIFIVSAQLDHAAFANNGSLWLLQIIAGGVTYESSDNANATEDLSISASTGPIRLAPGDTIQVKVKQSTGGTIQHTGHLNIYRLAA